jgi:hypothetical protein
MGNNSLEDYVLILPHVNPTYNYVLHACSLIIIHIHHALIIFQVGAMNFPSYDLFI